MFWGAFMFAITLVGLTPFASEANPVVVMLGIVATATPVLILLWRVASAVLTTSDQEIRVRNAFSTRSFVWEQVQAFRFRHGVLDQRSYIGELVSDDGTTRIDAILVNPVFERSVKEGEAIVAELNRHLEERTGRKVEEIRVPHDEIWFRGRLGKL